MVLATITVHNIIIPDSTLCNAGHRVFGHSLTAEGLQRIAPLMDYLKLSKYKFTGSLDFIHHAQVTFTPIPSTPLLHLMNLCSRCVSTWDKGIQFEDPQTAMMHAWPHIQ